MNDNVNHPKHYRKFSYECWEISNMFFMSGDIQNTWKYIYRYNAKGDKEENLKKARWYLEKEIDRYHKDEVRYEHVALLLLDHDFYKRPSEEVVQRHKTRTQAARTMVEEFEQSDFEDDVSACATILLAFFVEGGHDVDKLTAVKKIIDDRESSTFRREKIVDDCKDVLYLEFSDE